MSSLATCCGCQGRSQKDDDGLRRGAAGQLNKATDHVPNRDRRRGVDLRSPCLLWTTTSPLTPPSSRSSNAPTAATRVLLHFYCDNVLCASAPSFYCSALDWNLACMVNGLCGLGLLLAPLDADGLCLAGSSNNPEPPHVPTHYVRINYRTTNLGQCHPAFRACACVCRACR